MGDMLQYLREPTVSRRHQPIAKAGRHIESHLWMVHVLHTLQLSKAAENKQEAV